MQEGDLASREATMDDQDDAVAWVRERFDDPTYDRDARVLEHIARDPGFAGVIKEMMTRPAEGLRYRLEIGRPHDPELATAQALERLNARLRYIGAQAVSCEGEPGTTRGYIWRVRVPQSQAQYVQFLVSGAYGFCGAPDGEALATEVEELSPSQLEALRRSVRETRGPMQAAQARLQGEDLPETSASPSDMLHFLVVQETKFIDGMLSHLEHMDAIVAREQQRRDTRDGQGSPE
jgi:hypothetical protein